MPKYDIDRVYKDLDLSLRKQSTLFKQIKSDFEYELGKQWKEEDKKELEDRGIKALTINKLRPMAKMITGIERQSRSDFKAFPEGSEDELASDIATRLMKNIVKNSRVARKLSDQFKEGMIGGLCYLEPYMDYTFDLLNGELKFKKVNAHKILLDPGGEEYDLSDRKFIIKLTTDLSKEDLEELFPKKSKDIDKITFSRINMEYEGGEEKQERDYPSFFKDGGQEILQETERTYDLIEYYYKKMIPFYYVASRSQGVLAETENKEEAEAIIASNDIQDAVLIDRKVPEIRLKQVVGKIEFSDERVWSYPRWKSYPFFPFISEWLTFDGIDFDLSIQGFVRGLRDLQDEYNKRRTQSLNHLNSSINSGTIRPEGTLDSRNKDKLKRFGASPGVDIEYKIEKAGGTTPQQWRITPTPLSQGHEQLAAENAQDMKEGSGINADLLANTDKDASGRAILLKQRQGLVMVQESLDNYQHTKELLGNFILRQLGEVYSVETAIKVLGDGFIKENFKKPVFDVEGNAQVGEDGKIETEVNLKEAEIVINKILNDTTLGKYDVSVGEAPFSETIKLSNFLTVMDLIEKGFPIPPQIIIEESLLSDSQKTKIINAMSQVQVANV